jgi:copper(I)-binding protein
MSDEPSLARFSENTMRAPFKLLLIAVVISVSPAAIAQNGKASTIAVEQAGPGQSRRGAGTGALYMSLAETLPLTLTFAKAGNIPVTVPIQPIGVSQSGKGGVGAMEGMQGNKSGGKDKMEMK